MKNKSLIKKIMVGIMTVVTVACTGRYSSVVTDGAAAVSEAAGRVVSINSCTIQGGDGVVNISGVDDSTSIAVYTVSGQLVGITKANGNQASLSTNIKKGEIAIIKIGEKSVKCLMQ